MGSAVRDFLGLTPPKIPEFRPPPIPKPPTPEQQADVGGQAAATERQRLRRLRGVGSTLLTSPFGLETEATTGRKTLLGG